MKAGNETYLEATDISQIIPVFPLAGALLLPGGQMPLNIFEPRYLAMIDDAMHGNRLIGMIQPALKQSEKPSKEPLLCEIGCVGRITAFQECGDGRYMINLTGICRYRILEEVKGKGGYRQCKIGVFAEELHEEHHEGDVDRDALLTTFKRYLDANDMEADWESIDKADNNTLVTALCMMSPYGPAEKQALLEAPDLKNRADTLIAITEIYLARESDNSTNRLQ